MVWCGHGMPRRSIVIIDWKPLPAPRGQPVPSAGQNGERGRHSRVADRAGGLRPRCGMARRKRPGAIIWRSIDQEFAKPRLITEGSRTEICRCPCLLAPAAGATGPAFDESCPRVGYVPGRAACLPRSSTFCRDWRPPARQHPWREDRRHDRVRRAAPAATAAEIRRPGPRIKGPPRAAAPVLPPGGLTAPFSRPASGALAVRPPASVRTGPDGLLQGALLHGDGRVEQCLPRRRLRHL